MLHCQKSITRAKTGVTLPWNQINDNATLFYVLHLHKSNWNHISLFFAFTTRYCESQVFTPLVTAPARLRVTAIKSLEFPPRHLCEALSKSPDSAPKATAAGFWVCFFFFVSGKKKKNNFLPPPAPGFPRGLHAHLTSPSCYAIKAGWSPFWSTTSSRYLLSKWNKVVQCPEHRKKSKMFFSALFREQSLLGPAMPLVQLNQLTEELISPWSRSDIHVINTSGTDFSVFNFHAVQ